MQKKDKNIEKSKINEDSAVKDINLNKENKNNRLRNVLLGIIIFLLVIIIFLITLLFKREVINKKAKETIVSSKTVEEQSDLKEGIAKIYNSVVYIQVESKGGLMGSAQVSSGSGFIYKKEDKNIFILTNNHVISGADKVTVTYIDGTESDAVVVGSDELTDVAVLKVDSKSDFDVAELGNSETVEVGDTVFTVGAPLGKNYMGTITKGIISGTSRMVDVQIDSGSYLMETIQTDATINSGNSGGPLCNIKGQVIGINSSKLIGEGVEGMGFSIPISVVNSIIEDLEKGKTIERPYIGVQLADISNTFQLQYYYNIKISSDVTFGAVLSYVEKGKPAEKAGLQVGDVIVQIDDQKVDNVSRFRYLLYKHKVGDHVKIKYYRGNEMKETSISLNEKIK